MASLFYPFPREHRTFNTDNTIDGSASALSLVFIYWKCLAESAGNYIPETVNSEISGGA